jgi:hypothetical protein
MLIVADVPDAVTGIVKRFPTGPKPCGANSSATMWATPGNEASFISTSSLLELSRPVVFCRENDGATDLVTKTASQRQ